MSYSWVDPHFARLYAQREDARLTERLAAELSERAEREPFVPAPPVRSPSWFLQDYELRRIFRAS